MGTPAAQCTASLRAQQLHDEYRRKVWEDSKSGSENFDKYLLTFSSGALALSLSFIKDVVHVENVQSFSLLIVSWICFLACILITLISFRISLTALERMVPCLNDFYLNNDPEAYNRHLASFWSKAVDWCAYLGILFFVLGLVFTMWFVGINLQKESKMEKEKAMGLPRTVAHDALKPVGMTPLQEGIKVQPMTPMMSDLEKGLKPVPVTPVPVTAPQQPAQQNTPPPSQQGLKK